MRLTIILLCCSIISLAQDADDETEVKEVISRVFKAMELGDSAMLRTAFTPGATTATIFRDKNDAPVLRQEQSIRGFLNAVGTPHEEVWYEEIWNVSVRVDGDLARARCDYAFYAGDTFSHCGVDAFHLFRSKDGWKIFHLSDTRKKTGCEVPKEIQAKHQ